VSVLKQEGLGVGVVVLMQILALSTIPALLYTFLERGILRMNTTVLGARWVVLL
jgi:hypothetical protein